MGRALFVILILALGLGGCAVTPSGKVSAPLYFTEQPLHDGLTVSSDEGWWRISFSIDRPDPARTQWPLDLLIAHQVIAPVLVAYEQHLIAWRFHRRAANDETGHRFSFIFYAHRDIADKVYAEVQKSPMLLVLKQARRVTGDSYSDTSQIARPLIDDTSDPSWSPDIKAAWPIYINGVSQMWLTLIDIHARQLAAGAQERSLEQLEALYARINDQITASWREEGQHALLHHLNAMFGYEPVLIHDVQEKRF